MGKVTGFPLPVRVMCEGIVSPYTRASGKCNEVAAWVVLVPGQLPIPACDAHLSKLVPAAGLSTVAPLNAQGFYLMIQAVEDVQNEPETGNAGA